MKKSKKSKLKKIPEVRCRLCGEVIPLKKWRTHLAISHKIRNETKPKLRQFFIGISADLEKARREWYNPNKKKSISREDSFSCGTVVNGPPKVKIIYNAIFSNRKKF